MARYVDADLLYKEVTEKFRDINAGGYPFNLVVCDMARLVEKAPTADVVEVVRCKDCKYRETFACPVYREEFATWEEDGYIEHEVLIFDDSTDDFFCSYGKRKEGE